MMTKLDPKYLTCDFNFEAIGAVIVPFGEENKVIIAGNFRSHHDYIGVVYDIEDRWSHPDFSYPAVPDFSNIILSYDYEIIGAASPMNSAQGSPTLTITTVDNQEYYVRLWNYVIDRPVDDWEEGSGTLFPEGRTPGSATGTTGHIVIDFNNLYAGWRAYDDTFIDGQYTWIPSSGWEKVEPNIIKSLKWGITQTTYNVNDYTPLDDSYPFKIIFSNWQVDGNTYLGEDPQPLERHFYRLADGYDDNYNITPKRYIEQFYNLGFRKVINMYLGASHFYDKKSDGTPTPGEYEPYRYILKTEPVLNEAFKAWWEDFLKWAKYYGFKEIVASISMENVNIDPSWRQLTYDGQPATSGWTPTPYFVSFCNNDAKEYYKKYVKTLADMQSANGLPVFIQLGEPWWWWIENAEGTPPCFYDAATRQAHLQELGYEIPEWSNAWVDFSGHEETINWLQSKNGNFAHILRDHIRSYYPQAKFAVLFFPPSVLDEGRVPPMMSIVNFPQSYWKNIGSDINLSLLQVEDYDYLIYNQMDKHKDIYGFAWNYLQYQPHRTHYFAGFYPPEEVQNPQMILEGLWDRINEAAINGLNKEIESFIWAGSNIRSHRWLPPEMKWKALCSANVEIRW